MPFKDPAKEREWRKKYRAAHPEQRKQTVARYVAKHKEKILAYGREYSKRTYVIAKRAKDYLEHREERLLNAKKNRLMKGYSNPPYPIYKRRKSSRESARRKRSGITIYRNENGYFWKAGHIQNGYFTYRKECVKDAEKAFFL